MKLLSVETATEACSAALIINGTVTERYELTQRDHTRLILPMIDRLMTEANLMPGDLDGLAFGRGPGSFTGIRIATGIVHGIALGADLPVVPVSTLAALAQDFFDNYHEHQIAYTAMDARMGEIYWGIYERGPYGFAKLIGIETVTMANTVEFPGLIGAGVGSGWGAYRQELLDRSNGKVSLIESTNFPRARAIARLGAYGFDQGMAVDVEQALPVYIRDKVAKKESER